MISAILKVDVNRGIRVLMTRPWFGRMIKTFTIKYTFLIIRTIKDCQKYISVLVVQSEPPKESSIRFVKRERQRRIQ